MNHRDPHVGYEVDKSPMNSVLSDTWRASVVARYCLLGLITCLILGCKEEVAETQIGAETKLRPLARMYAGFVNQNRGRPPKDEAQFRKFAEATASQYLPEGLTLDQLFVSDRDNEPFVIVYGRVLVSREGVDSPMGARIVAYEKTGADGARFVADDLGVVELVDDEKFRQLVPNATP